jgi:uncharacterized membrane protein YkvA (DUF1232 family)
MKQKQSVSTNKHTQMSFLRGLIKQVKLVWMLLKDGRVSALTKSVIPLSLLYIISPIDFVPDVLLGLGQLDDFGVILLGMTLFVKLCPPELVDHYAKQLDYGADFFNDNETVESSFRRIDED